MPAATVVAGDPPRRRAGVGALAGALEELVGGVDVLLGELVDELVEELAEGAAEVLLEGVIV